MAELNAQQRANAKQNEKRKGQAQFSAVRFKSEADLKAINDTIKKSGLTKEQAMIRAFELLAKEL